MSSNNDEVISNFTAITGVDPDRAKFYLESSGWNFDVAVGTFYEQGDDEMADAGAADAPPEPEEDVPRPVAMSAPKPRIATLSNMHQDSDSDPDSEEEGQAFYAGGSERGGGQQIIGPKKKNADKVVKDVFESAQKHGAETVEAGSSGGSGRSGKPTFRGTGYKLGDSDAAPVEKVQGAPIDKPRNVDLVLKMWKNGFSVSDGPLRDYNDPASMEFIGYIKKGEIPPELTRMAKGGEVNLDMEDHRTEEYVKPKATVKPFQGSGNRLGSVAPPVATSAPPAEAQSNETTAKSSVPVDKAKPVTNVQIRMADGGRLVAQFNHSHTVADIRTYIELAHPQYTGANYALMTTFPNRELTDAAQTLEDAKLLNAAIVQRMK